jgi:hypothetical protein
LDRQDERVCKERGHLTPSNTQQIWDLGGNGCINSIRPSAETGPGGNETGSVSTSRTTTPKTHAHRYIDHHGVVPIQAVDVSDDSRTLVAISNHGTVFVWDPSRGALGGGHHRLHHGGSGSSSFPTGTAPSTPFTEEEGSGSAPGGAVVDALGQSTLLKPVTKFRAHAPGYYCLYGKISPGTARSLSGQCSSRTKHTHSDPAIRFSRTATLTVTLLCVGGFCFSSDVFVFPSLRCRLPAARDHRKRRDGQAVGHDDVGAHRYARE